MEELLLDVDDVEELLVDVDDADFGFASVGFGYSPRSQFRSVSARSSRPAT
jgi:hypothetical protein